VRAVLLSELLWVWGFAWVWVRDKYGDYDQFPWAMGILWGFLEQK